MLSSPRALAHSSWLTATCSQPSQRVLAGLKRRPTARYISTSSSTHFAGRLSISTIHHTAFERTVENSLRTEGPSNNPVRTGRLSAYGLVDLVKAEKYQDADIVLSQLLEQGTNIPPDQVFDHAIKDVILRPHPENHVTTFTNWLTLLPDKNSANPDEYQQYIDLLSVSPQQKVPLMLRFGEISSTKGYMDIIEKQIVPLVARTVDPATLARFTSYIYKADRQYKETARICGEEDKTFLEDMPDDYTTVMADFTAPSPPVVEQVQQNLPKLLPEPVDGTAIFEEPDDDYIDHLITSPDLRAHSTSADMLEYLTRSGKHEHAYQLLLELRSLHLEIPFSNIYWKAAQETFQSGLSSGPSLTVQERADRFAAWVSLTCPAHLIGSQSEVERTLGLLIRAPVTNMLMISRFAVILASKGYSDIVSIRAFPAIMRFAEKDVRKQFLADFQQAIMSYWMSRGSANALLKANRAQSNSWGIAIRYLTFSKRLEEAIGYLRQTKDKGFKLTPYTYGVVLRGLREERNPALMGHMAFVRSLYIEEPPWDPSISLYPDLLNTMTTNAHMRSQLGTAAPVVFNDDLTKALRHLKRALTSNRLPHPLTVTRFITAYTALNRNTALILLLKKALRNSYKSTSIFLTAEMLHYKQQGQHDLVFQTFVEHFYLSGVPRDDLLARYRSNQRDRYARPGDQFRGDNEPGSIPQRCIPDIESINFPRGKLWPEPVHCSIVWQSLAAVTSTPEAIERLYRKLVRIANEGANRPEVAEYDSDPLLPPPSWKEKVGSGAFMPFMRRLIRGFDASRGAAVLSDMVKAGIQPTVYHFTELAGQYATMGDVPRALLILDKMEANLAKDSSIGMLEDKSAQSFSRGQGVDNLIDSKNHPSSPESIQSSLPEGASPLTFPRPDIVMYISLLRGFILSKSLQGAEEVEKRLRKVHNYVPGDNEYLDTVYQDLETLKSELKYK